MDPSKDGVITRYPPILIKSKLIISNNSDFVRSKIEISIFHIDNTPLEGVVFYYDHPIRRLVPHPYFYGCRVTSRWECWLNKCSSNKLNQTLVSAGAMIGGGVLVLVVYYLHTIGPARAGPMVLVLHRGVWVQVIHHHHTHRQGIPMGVVVQVYVHHPRLTLFESNLNLFVFDLWNAQNK